MEMPYIVDDSTLWDKICINKRPSKKMFEKIIEKKINGLEKEIELKDSWVKHHQRACEIAMSDRTKLEQKLKIAVEALEEIVDGKAFLSQEVATEALEKLNYK